MSVNVVECASDIPSQADSSNQTALAELGITVQQLTDHNERPVPKSFTVAWCETPDGDPIAGIVHQCDYRAEEEYGVGDIRRAITGSDIRQFCMTESGRHHAATFSDVRGLVLTSRPLDKPEFLWGEPLHGDFQSWDYGRAWGSALPWTRRLDQVANTWMSMAELRNTARTLGIKPLPRSKADIVEAILIHPDAGHQLPDLWPGIFDSSGTTLVLRAEGETLTCRVIAKLADAIRVGTLGIGSASGPFHTGSFYYDTRDETPGLIQERTERFDWHDARMAELKPVKQTLEARGHRWYALGSPSVIAPKGKTEREVHYWLNGTSHPRYGGQPYGWYTLQELLDEKFVVDSNERARS